MKLGDLISETLRDHQPRRGVRDLRKHCECGWVSVEQFPTEDPHRDHVAAVLTRRMKDAAAGSQSHDTPKEER